MPIARPLDPDEEEAIDRLAIESTLSVSAFVEASLVLATGGR
jgi:hypothetical protein